MKRLAFITTLYVVALLCGCKTPEIVVPCACEDVTQPSDMPWLEELVQGTGGKIDGPMEFVDKLFYTLPDSEDVHVGFFIQWNAIPGSDIPYQGMLDCDGNWLTMWGGYTGCDGLCNFTTISRERVYQREKTEQEIYGEAIAGKWIPIAQEYENQYLRFWPISVYYGNGEMYYQGPLADESDWERKSISFSYNISADSITLRRWIYGSSSPLFEYTTHYSIVQDTLLTIDRFSADGSYFREQLTLSLQKQ